MDSIAAKHPFRVAKAVVTNIVAICSPKFYARWTGETGRGRQPVSIDATADYFIQCVKDYRSRLGVSEEEFRQKLIGKTVLEYGPGDIPGVALLLVALGARRVCCVDRFPLIRLDEFNRNVLDRIVQSLTGEDRIRAEKAKADLLAPVCYDGAIKYIVARDGVSGLQGEADFIFSRAVLEHVGDLDVTFSDMYKALSPHGMALHFVDLKSHGLHLSSELDFLLWPHLLWLLMYGAKGVPNRERPSRYLELARQNRLNVLVFEPSDHADEGAWNAVKGRLPFRFAQLSKEDISCRGFWLHMAREI